MTLHIHTHADPRVVIDAVTTRLQTGTPHPLSTDAIVCASPGLASALQLALTERCGGWAHGRPIFPAAFCRAVVAGRPVGRADDAVDPWASHGLALALVDILPVVAATTDGAPLRRWLDAPIPVPGPVGVARRDPKRERLVDLADRVAEVFDGYLGECPGLLRAWDADRPAAAVPGLGRVDTETEAWQRAVWLHLRDRIGGPPLALAVDDPGWAHDLVAARIGDRVTVIASASMARVHVEVLVELGRVLDVGVFVVCAGDDGGPAVGEAFETAAARRDRTGLLTWQAVADDRGVPLVTTPLPEAPSVGTTLLTAVQTTLAGRAPHHAVAAPCDSLRGHACHTRLREVEVLRDELLAAFDPDHPLHVPGLRADDVVVQVSDIEAYAPLIDAVFGAPASNEHGRIPYVIAERSVRSADHLVETAFAVIDAARGRLGLEALAGVVARRSVRRRFGLAADDVPLAIDALRGAGARWGWDATERARERAWTDELHTLRHAADRILLGAVHVPAHTAITARWAGLSAVGAVDASTTAAVARVVQVAEALALLRHTLAVERTPADQADALRELAATFLVADVETSVAALPWLDAVDAMHAHAAAAGADATPVPWTAIAHRLDALLRARYRPVHRVSGVVIFAEPQAVVDVPARVVGLLGYDDDALPRRQTTPGFDLLRAWRVDAARDRADADRTSFQHALLAASDRVIVTWRGRDVRTDAERPASVMVEELIDTAHRLLGVDPDDAHAVAARGVVLHHPLHPWSPRYDAASGADARLVRWASVDSADVPAAEFAADTEPADLEPLDTWTVDALVRALCDAPATWLQHALGVRIESIEAGDVDELDLQVNPLEEWKLGDDALTHLLMAPDLTDADLVAHWRDAGLLPVGRIGDDAAAGVLAHARSLVERVRHENRVPVRHVDARVSVGDAGAAVAGRLHLDAEGHLTRVDFGKLKKKRTIRLQVETLLAAAADVSAQGHLYTRSTPAKRIDATAPSPQAASDALAEIVTLAERARREPLPLTDKVYEQVAGVLADGGDAPDRHEVLAAVRKAIAPRSSFGGSSNEPSKPGLHSTETDNTTLARVFGETDTVERMVERGALEVVRTLRCALGEVAATDEKGKPQ